MEIIQGSTFLRTLYWGQETCVFLPVDLVPGAPVRFNAPLHGLPPVWFVNVQNSINLDETQLYTIKVVDPDTLEIDCMNGTGFQPEAVLLKYSPPVDLSGYSARSQIRNRVGGEVLLEMLSGNPAGMPRIVIDNVNKSIMQEIPASVTETFTWRRGVTDLEMFIGQYVIKIDSTNVVVVPEVTR